MPIGAQNIRVEVGKRSTAIPKGCESIAPASIEGNVDVPALLKEAACKGAGDMLSEYTYELKAARRQGEKTWENKEETTYEVYIPTLKSGTRARGILLVTSRNGVPVPPRELEKERLRAGERLEKEENAIARRAATLPEVNSSLTGIVPLGMYPHFRINRNSLGIKRGSAVLSVHTFLRTCDLTLLRREQNDGRETLVFSFVPYRAALFNDAEKYVAQLNGAIWIDAKDRIVTRLAGWPVNARQEDDADWTALMSKRPPAVYVEMTRLPHGVWLPSATRLNGADYPTLFDRITYDSTFTYSEYKRFSTEVQDVKLETPKPPL